jgi:hypothetical protein
MVCAASAASVKLFVRLMSSTGGRSIRPATAEAGEPCREWHAIWKSDAEQQGRPSRDGQDIHTNALF